ncbi:MAG: GntR family transcriptional regulator [Oscillospiraceae bacterium]|nr:GntR family transcriptional regulator [Oscillospiraceae bacterium]
MIKLDYRDARPIYVQIKEGIKALLVSGALAPGERLPSVRELATQLTINPNTIARAYRELTNEGFLYSVPGRGSFAVPEEDTAKLKKQELFRSFDKAAKDLTDVGVGTDELIDRLRTKEGSK